MFIGALPKLTAVRVLHYESNELCASQNLSVITLASLKQALRLTELSCEHYYLSLRCAAPRVILMRLSF